jgi:hypothetical protein
MISIADLARCLGSALLPDVVLQDFLRVRLLMDEVREGTYVFS